MQFDAIFLELPYSIFQSDYQSPPFPALVSGPLKCTNFTFSRLTKSLVQFTRRFDKRVSHRSCFPPFLRFSLRDILSRMVPVEYGCKGNSSKEFR